MSNMIHINVVCQDCDFIGNSSFPEVKKMRYEAITHSKKTGHSVVFETGYTWRYENGKSVL